MINTSDVMALIDLIDNMNSEQRLLLLDKYCRSCGDIKPDEDCHNTECIDCPI